MNKVAWIVFCLVFFVCAATAHAQPICTLEEALDNPALTWSTGGTSQWFCQDIEYYYGGSSAQSGQLADNETGFSYLQTTFDISEPQVLSFRWKIAAPPTYSDYMVFYVDNETETYLYYYQSGWQQHTVQLLPGTHTLRWEYIKTGTSYFGYANAGWVDSVEIADPHALQLLAYYADTYALPRIPTPLFAKKKVAKASPDECYDNGTVGEPDEFDNCTFGTEKTNQAYVWGLAQSGNLWFGTVANTHCLVMGGLLGGLVGSPGVIEAQNFVCEFAEADNATSVLGDWRSPQIFEYDPETMALIDRTPVDMLANPTLGIRSAGALDGVVLLAGPSLDQTAVNVFAFSDDGTYLGMHVLAGYSNIRQWVVYDGIMYTGVQSAADATGRVLRWNGDINDPFQFEVVGRLDLDVANMAVHQGRLFATTWPSLSVATMNPNVSGLWMSPEIPSGTGLTGSDNDTWQKVWSVTDYEPDTVVARTYGGGALFSHEGTLYWGTMHVPFTGTLAAVVAAQRGLVNLTGVDNETLDVEDIIATALGTHRAVSIFSSTFENSSTTIDLLYGDEYLPVYDPDARSYTIAYDDMHRNNMPNPEPRWGSSGIGNFFNAYTWTMDLGFVDYPDKGGVLLGTFDWSFVARDLAGMFFNEVSGPPELEFGLELFMLAFDQLQQLYASYGSDLYVIRSAEEPFILESNDGQGNYLNYGIRTMLVPDTAAPEAAPAATLGDAPAADGDCRKGYLGMANPFNLAEEGGWELVEIYPLPEVEVVAPAFQELVQGDVVLQAQDLSACPLNNVVFYVADIFAQVSVFPATYNEETEMWEYVLGTAGMPMPNGIYTVFAIGTDAEGAAAQGGVVPFVIANDCVQDSDCDDGLWCSGVETCNETLGACVLGTSPCEPGLVCDEDNATCVECIADGDCGEGYTCQDSVCVQDCRLYIKYKKLFAWKLAKKARKCMLKITGDENFDIYGEIDLGPLTWEKVKFNPRKNMVKIKAVVPQGLPAGVYPIRVGDCMAEITIL